MFSGSNELSNSNWLYEIGYILSLNLHKKVKIIVHVKKGASPIEEKEGLLIVQTKEKRENNRANMDVINQVAKFYGIQVQDVKILSGFSSRKKILRVEKD